VRLATVDGRVVADRARALPGRGFYVCGRDCLRRAAAGKALARAARGPAAVDAEKLDLG